MTRIALLTCSNTTQDMGCSSFMCLENMRKSSGQFTPYKDKGGAELAASSTARDAPRQSPPRSFWAASDP